MRIDSLEIHLRYKIEKHCGQYEDRGIMSSYDVATDILHSIYPVDEVEVAINTLAKEEFFEIYYTGKCPHCGGEFSFLETDAVKGEVIHGLLTLGEPCRGCLKNMYRPKVVNKYAIAQKRLEMTGYDSPKDVSIIERIKKWLKIAA